MIASAATARDHATQRAVIIPQSSGLIDPTASNAGTIRCHSANASASSQSGGSGAHRSNAGTFGIGLPPLSRPGERPDRIF